MDTAAAPSIGYSAIEGMPAGLNGPNVIVVDTSSLKTREEEEKVCSFNFNFQFICYHPKYIFQTYLRTACSRELWKKN